ncbi:acetate/propionate family kinase [Actinomadura sp. DC4]|uniref:acetate/propionate family kinase n=1 Tax=Actinomadura sp. DC4 TaxID=3055069 RepID=UPI0025B0F702|nr:acetate/propionate family kinase [Actinomadura sp. DC4]MDN3358720.1 acetate/propionate family kinase [Actinomadura sp. DC4]
MRILVVNAGSSSLKLSLLDHDDTVIARPADLSALRGLPEPDAIGHRVVHGGAEFTDPVLLDADVEARIRALTELAPLHQPKSLRGIDTVRRVLPDLPEVACFDTAFHAHLPEAAATYALPAAWRQRYGLRRYGFHGLSHAYATRRAGAMLGAVPRRLVVCHLGAGASLCAVAGGRSVDTTMGFTPLEGLVMATRSGDVDPGLLLWLQERENLSPAALADVLEHESGLLALAGTADMRAIHDGLALDVYVHRLRAGIAGMTAALGGLDALVFTGGVGEHAVGVRRRAAEGLGFLGVAVDPAAEDTVDADISVPGAAVRTLVIAAREDLEIAAGVRTVLNR